MKRDIEWNRGNSEGIFKKLINLHDSCLTIISECGPNARLQTLKRLEDEQPWKWSTKEGVQIKRRHKILEFNAQDLCDLLEEILKS
jgi:hypothetical protein